MDNQTEELWILHASANHSGTGLFALTNADVVKAENRTPKELATISGGRYGKITKVVLSDITYLKCVELGCQEGVVAYKWIPQLLASEQMVTQSALNCDSLLCVRRCAGYGCLCIDGSCT